MQFGRDSRSCWMSDERESDDRDFAESFRREYHRTPLPEPEAQARIDAAVRKAAKPRRAAFGVSTWLEPRTITLRPLVAVVVVIALMGVGALLSRVGSSRRGPPGG